MSANAPARPSWFRRLIRGATSQALDEMIPAAATSAVERYLNSDAFGAMVRRIAFEKSPRYRFLTWMAWRFMAVNKAMTGEAAIRLAANTLGQFLKDDHIAFGHPDYAWDRAAAITLANECEIEHWEAAA